MTFEEFATARLPALMRYAFLLSTDRELARDLVQEVLARAMVRWPRIARADDPYAYVRVMVTNEYFSLRRRKALRTIALTYEALDGPRAPAHPDPTVVLSDRDELWRHLGALPRQQRAVIVLRYYEDLSDNQIAEALGCSPGTVRGYAARAMAALRIELAPDPQPAPTNRGAA